jgi:hypothetical protein
MEQKFFEVQFSEIEIGVGAGAKPDRDGAKPDAETEQNQTL